MKYFRISFILLIVSCTNSGDVIVVDSYFAQIYNLNPEEVDDLIITDVDDFMVENYLSFDRLYLSPLLFNNYEELFTGSDLPIENVYVVDPSKMYDDFNVIPMDYTIAYRDLIEELKSEGQYSKIAVLIDYELEEKKQNVKTLKKIDDIINFEFLFVNNNIGRATIIKFVESHKNVDLWIIDSRKFGYYIYELLEKEKIVLVDGEKIANINENVVYTINANMSENLQKIIDGESNKIEFKLKKH